MAKKKEKSIEPIIDEIMVADEVIEEEVSEEIIEEVIEETPVVEEKCSDLEKFIDVQLKIINRMSNSAKAQRLGNRVLRNRKGK